MKLFFSIILLLLAPSLLFADDGVFFASGNTLVPLHESSIALKKEVLKLKKNKNYMDVDVYFEFDNPKQTRKETVGFVVPNTEMTIDSFAMPYVKDFSVTMNDSVLHYTLSRFEQTGFKRGKKMAAVVDTGDFIYYFSATFKPGLNTIHHFYRFRAGLGQTNDAEYAYKLMTGTSWANGEMEDFTLTLDLGPDAYFYLPQTFWKNGSDIPWQIQGDGILSRAFENPDRYDSSTFPAIHFVKMHSGTISCHLMHFRPDYDFWTASPRQYNLSYWVSRWFKQENPTLLARLDTIYQPWGMDLREIYTDEDQLPLLHDSELLYLRNLPFAFHDCSFKNEKLTNYYSQFNWYYPYKDRLPDIKLLDPEEAKLIAAVDTEIRRRKK